MGNRWTMGIWIDTAALYGLGHSEEVVGKALKGKRENIFLATKCGMIWDDNLKLKEAGKARYIGVCNYDLMLRSDSISPTKRGLTKK